MPGLRTLRSYLIPTDRVIELLLPEGELEFSVHYVLEQGPMLFVDEPAWCAHVRWEFQVVMPLGCPPDGWSRIGDFQTRPTMLPWFVYGRQVEAVQAMKGEKQGNKTP